MAWYSGLLRRSAPAPKPAVATFSTFQPLSAYLALAQSQSAPVTRAEALSVAGMARGRDLLCGAIASLPLVQYDPNNEQVDNPLLRQLDNDVANVVHIAMTVEDLALCGLSWWEILGFGWDGFPVSVRRVAPESVSFQDPNTYRSRSPLPGGYDPRGATVWLDGRPVDPRTLIRFDSPNRPILETGARVIRRAILLDKAAKVYAETPSPGAILSPTPDAEPLSDPEQKALIDKYQALVRSRGAVYADAITINPAPGANPAELQLVQLAQEADREICLLWGIDPEEAGLNVTARTYFNAQDRRLSRVNDVLSPYMRAITDRLSMGDVTPRGHKIRFLLDDFLKADALTRAQVAQIWVQLGVKDRDEVRADEGLPPATTPAPQPIEAPQPNGPSGPSDAQAPMPEEVPA